MLNSILKPFEPYLPENNRLERIWKLAQVDFKKRYYNDKLGLFWALLNPVLRICVYYLVFTYIFEYAREGIDNYALFLFAGLILWLSFMETSNKGLNIIQSKKYLLENIQFNKLDLFYSQTLSTLLGFSFNLVAYLAICLILGTQFDWDILFIPIPIISIYLIGLGACMILATINIYLRDINHAWTIITLIGFWSSGILFRGEEFIRVMPEFIYINPFVGIIMNFRAMTIGGTEIDWWLCLVNMTYGIIVFLIGRWAFNKYSHKALELI